MPEEADRRTKKSEVLEGARADAVDVKDPTAFPEGRDRYPRREYDDVEDNRDQEEEGREYHWMVEAGRGDDADEGRQAERQ